MHDAGKKGDPSIRFLIEPTHVSNLMIEGVMTEHDFHPDYYCEREWVICKVSAPQAPHCVQRSTGSVNKWPDPSSEW